MIKEEMMPMLTVSDVSQILNLSSDEVMKLESRGTLKSYRVNRQGDRRFMREDIISFMDEFNGKVI